MQALYLNFRYDAPLTPEQSWSTIRVRIASETGWSLEYIDNLAFPDISQFLQYWSAKSKIEEAQAKSARTRGRRGRRK